MSIEPIVAHPQPGTVDPGRTPPVVNHGPRTHKVVALTFDADMTPSMLAALDAGQVKSYANLAILDILEERQVPATFFITGMWAQRYPDVVGRIAAQKRNEIANHTYRHAAYKPNCYTLEQLPRTEMTADARRTFDVLAPFGGNQTRYFRFPGLCHDSAALTALAPSESPSSTATWSPATPSPPPPPPSCGQSWTGCSPDRSSSCTSRRPTPRSPTKPSSPSSNA